MNAPDQAAVGWTTTSTIEDAKLLCQRLVGEKLVACSQISGPLISSYFWKENVESEEEYRITLKFMERNADAIEAFLNEFHPYEVCQWLWIRCDRAGAEYLKWMSDETV